MLRELGVAVFLGGGRSQVCPPRFGWFLWTGVVIWVVPSTFWAVFVDGGGVLVCAVHVLGGFVDGGGVLGQVLGCVWRRGYSIRIEGLVLWGIVAIFA